MPQIYDAERVDQLAVFRNDCAECAYVRCSERPECSNSTYGNDRPNLSAGSATLGVNNFIAYDASSVNLGNPTHWFNPLMFTLPPQGYLGNAGRDILRGPGLRNWDFSVVKDTRMKFLGEAGNLEFRAEFFNLLNKANFAMPNATVFAGTTAGSGVVEAPLSTAGSITATTTSARQIQLALKVIF